ncbi:MAG: DNA polymerase IV [Cellulosilyticaceae bacterium]
MDRIILHCDLNNFFASVECLLNPTLKGFPMAVGGSIEDRHGIILAKSEEAKKFGVKTAEVIWEAKQKCPDLIVVPSHAGEYLRYSKKVHEIYKRFTDLVEPFGIDECWLDVTGSTHLFGSGASIAYQIKEAVKEELGLTISVGVSFNKIFAKLGSDLKKPDGITCICQNTFRQKIWPLPASDLLGVGHATAKKLSLYGIHTIGALAQSDPEFLQCLLGKNGQMLHTYANGQDHALVMHQDYQPPVQSIGNSTTCSHDLTDMDEVFKVFLLLAEKVSHRLRENTLLTSKIQIWIKDTTLHGREFQTALSHPTRCSRELADLALTLFKRHYHWHTPVRALGIRAIELSFSHAPTQYSLFSDYEQTLKHERMETAVDQIRGKYGAHMIRRASLLTPEKLPTKLSDESISLPSPQKNK